MSRPNVYRWVLACSLAAALVVSVAVIPQSRAHDLAHAADPGPSLLPPESKRPVTNIYLTVAAGQGGR